MKRLFCAALLALALSVPAAWGQDSSSAAPQKDAADATQAAEKAAKPKAKIGTDCSPNRAGGRCSKPKPRKPWFFGKA